MPEPEDTAASAFASRVDAAAGPLRRMAVIAAQVGLSKVPADASCHCLCSIYVPHRCDGWRADGCQREIPGTPWLLQRSPEPTVVPLCRGCAGAALRQS